MTTNAARVKLLTPWCGTLPEWYPLFKDRLAAQSVVDHELIETTLEEMRALTSARLGTPVRKNTFYNVACDLRPMYGEVFADLYRGYEFWGWCDLDVVFGDLARLLPPLLDANDVVTADARTVSGSFTALRNDPKLTMLFRWDDRYKAALADPDYWNFDETGFDDGDAPYRVNPSLNALLRSSGFRVHFDARTWVESHDLLPDSGVPSKCCNLWGDRLYETPTGRELLTYHFTKVPKTWPLSTRYVAWTQRQREYFRGRLNPPSPRSVPDLLMLQESSVTSATYWDARVSAVLDAGLQVHQTVYDCPKDVWDRIQRQSLEALHAHVPNGSTVLDVGCGYGALWGALENPPCSPVGPPYRVSYTGIDVSPRAVVLAKERSCPSLSFYTMDARSISFADDEFDWCVCRGLEGSVRVREGNAEWARFRDEMLRVAPRVLLLDYSGGAKVLKRENYKC